MKSVFYRQLIFVILLLLAFILVVAALLLSNGSFAAVIDDEGQAKKALNRYNDVDVVIGEDEKVYADFFIADGVLTIHGEIYGDVVAIWSEVQIKRTARIFGNIVSYHSEIKKDEDSKIAGDLISISSFRVRISDFREIPGYRTEYHLFSKRSDDEGNMQVVIGKDETISGDVIVFGKELSVKGKVDGDLYCLDGDVYLAESAAVDGHAINFDGRLEVAPNALVTGELFDGASEVGVVEQQEKFDERDEEIQEDIERRFLRSRSKRKSDIFRFWGNVTIEEDEVISGSVVVMKGKALIRGEVDGEVVSIFGDVELDSLGYVSGDVVSVGGKIYRDRGSFVGGDVVQTTWRGVKVEDDKQHVDVGWTGVQVKPKDEDEWERRKSSTRNYDDDVESDNFMFRYNRVEGLFLGVRVPRNDWYKENRFSVSVYGHAGYGFQNKDGRFQVGIERRFFSMSVGAEAHDLTDTQDRWIMSTFENSLAAFFLREDFHDFYRRNGASAYLTQNITPHFSITAGYQKDKYHNMKKETNWSLFGGNKKFRDNPLIDELELKSGYLKITLDTRNDFKYPTQGWFINLLGEFAGPDFENAGLDFDRYILDIRRYQPIGYGENFDFRLRAGSARGFLPTQFRFDLGGISTLRGYKFKEFKDGDRMILGNAEYRLYGPRGILNHLWFNDVNLILFADAGLVWNAVDKSGACKSFDDIEWDDLMTDVGIAFSNYEGNVRVSVAKQMHDKDKPLVVTFRIRKPF